MTPRTTATAAARKSRRPLHVGAVVLALLGGGTAYGISQYSSWYPGGGSGGLTCMATWHSAPESTGADVYGGQPLTTDPIADCARYAQLTGKPAVKDPVATRWYSATVVGPREGRPAAAVPLGAPTADAAAVVELDQSLADYVDGGLSQCFTTATAKSFVNAELTRLGLQGFTVKSTEQQPSGGHCALMFRHASPDSESSENRMVEIRGHFGSDPSGGNDQSHDVIAALRTKVAGRCLSLSQAQHTTAAILGRNHHWPTATINDAHARCTRVDFIVSGSEQVFLRGPAG